jgi:agmatine deiminase
VSLLTANGVAQVSLPHDDCWIRDYGPTFLVNKAKEIAGVTWRWNAWGFRYEDHERDAKVAEEILKHLEMRRYSHNLVLEGGGVDVDGEGTVIASEATLLNSNRNPNMTREQVEEVLIEHLGVQQVIWLGEGLQDDMTGGQIGNIARFVRPGVVLALTCSDPADPNQKVLADNLQRLKAARNANGQPLEVLEVEQPRPLFDEEGRRLALSYVNLYMANDGIVMPAFDDSANDRKAFDVMTKLFPRREIVQIPALELAYGGGGIHAFTLPQPVGTILKP